jgi:DNA replication protein DnaC
MKDETLRKILSLYEKKRDKAEYELEQRKNDVYKQIPEIENIDNEISKTGLSLAKLVIMNPKNKDKLVQEVKEKIDQLKIEKQKLLGNVPSGYLDVQYECNVCNDKGFLSNGKKCNCLKQAIINETYKMSNLENVLKKENYDTFDPSIFSKEINAEIDANISPYDNMMFNVADSCKNFTYNFHEDNGKNLLFYGSTGLGKTFMCNCIAKELLDQGYVVIYQTAFKMFEIIEDYKFKNGDTHISKDNYENLFDCDLLIIDDLGTELTNSFTNSELFNIINTRLLSGKKTIISTNLSPTQLEELYTERTSSRIFDRFEMIKFIGNDLRWYNKK